MSTMAKNYKEAVERCKALVKQRNDLKYEIVKIALNVCIIKEGNNQSHSMYTLTNFAKDIGVATGTLNRWKCEYENVIKKVTPKNDPDFKLDKHAMGQAMKKVKKDTPAKEVKKIYDRYRKYSNKEDKTLRCYVDRLRSMHFFICYTAQIDKLNKDDVEQMKTYCKEMYDCIEKQTSFKTKKPSKKALKLATEMLNQ